MYIDTNTIIHVAELLGAVGVVVGLIISVYKIIDGIKTQGRQIAAIMDELTIIDYGLKGALEGLVERGANGPCKDALAKLDAHLIKQAHGGCHEDQ